MTDEHTLKAKAEADLNEDARLLILQILAEEQTNTLNDYLIGQRVRSRWGVPRPPDWIETQLRALETRGAVTIIAAGERLFVRLTKAGQLHVQRVEPIAGIRWPPLEA